MKNKISKVVGQTAVGDRNLRTADAWDTEQKDLYKTFSWCGIFQIKYIKMGMIKMNDNKICIHLTFC